MGKLTEIRAHLAFLKAGLAPHHREEETMSRGLNRVQLIGNLGQRPETRQTSTGTLIANLRLATSSSWKDKAGERQEATEWHRCVAFGRLAEIAQQYLDKGSKVYIEGRIQTRKWNGDDGCEH